MEPGKRSVIILAILLAVWVCSCSYLQNPTTPRIGAEISDQVTSATVQLEAVGECDFVASHCHLPDGSTTGTVTVKITKNTANNFLVGALSALGGWILHGATKIP